MSRPTNDDDFISKEKQTNKRNEKVAKIFVLAIFIGFLWLILSSAWSVKKEDEAKPKPTYSARVSSSIPLDPATLRVQVSVLNTGQTTASARCTVELYNNSRVYTGLDSFMTTELAPGAEASFLRDVVITKEGAAFVSNYSVKCD